jgi:predicted nucleotidyltransferase
MRLDQEIVTYLKQVIQAEIPGSTIFLFGSRADDNARGGDIDLLILTNEQADKRIFRKIRLEFIKKFGWRKIDLVNFTYSNHSAFRKLIDLNSIQL